MDNFDFTLENIRFHLYKENTLVFNGWFRDDNPDGRQIKIYLDSQEIPFEIEIKKGIEIRQKYLYRNANVSEEIFGKVSLPDTWKENKKLAVMTLYKDKESVNCSIDINNLSERQNQVEYFVETQESVENRMVMSGWAMAATTPEIELLCDGKVVNAEVTRTYRKDVQAVFPEAEKDVEAGFKIVVSNPPKGKYKLVIKCGAKKSIYVISRGGLKNKGTKDKLFTRGIRYMKRYGLAAALKQTRRKLLDDNIRPVDLYPAWIKKYGVKPDELESQRNVKFEYEPKFSIVIPLYNTRI